MALTVKHLNADASFLLSFEPLPSSAPPGTPIAEPFRVILDPWITGPSKIFHHKIAISTHKEPACISTLQELPEPDVVIISQHKTDHCNEATLRQLPASGTKTIILAEPASARLIRSWKYFEPAKVRTIPRWEDPRLTGRDTIIRVPVPPAFPGGEPGELTVAFIPQRRDISGLHAAVGITYRAPPIPDRAPSVPVSPLRTVSFPESETEPSSPRVEDPTTPTAPAIAVGAVADILTPPDTPKSQRAIVHLPTVEEDSPSQPIPPMLNRSDPPTPISPTSLRSYRSASSLPQLHIPPPPRSPRRPSSSSSSATITASTVTASSAASFTTATSTTSISLSSPTRRSRPLSVIFSPHGISYSSLHGYTTSHLVAETALPLTCLLHCFDAVSNPWWLGGNVLLGAPAGQETAMRLGAKAWISAHDGDKEVRGLATKLLRTVKWEREVLQCLSASEFVIRKGVGAGAASGARGGYRGTEVLALGSGQEVVLSSEGVWRDEGERKTEARSVEMQSDQRSAVSPS